MYDHYFSNFGRPPVSDNICKDSATRHSRFWRRGFLKVFPYKCIGKQTWPCRKNNQMSIYDLYFSNFGRPHVPNDLSKDSAPRHPQFWRRRCLKVFTHIWAWRPSWSTSRDHFSNLSYPQPKKALYEIWAKLAQRLQRRSRLKFWIFFPYKCIRKQNWPYRKKVKCQCTTIILATLVDFPFPMISAKIQPQGILGFGEKDF